MNWNELTKDQKLWYFGGLIDGEGHIGCQYHGKRKRPVIQLQMTCEDTVKRFAEHFNLKVRILKSPSRIKHSHWKTIFHTRAECLKALPILKELEPYLFFKKDNCKSALEYYINRKCLICKDSLADTANKRVKYCCAACRQKAKRQKKNP